MLHHSAVDDELKPFQPRRPSIPDPAPFAAPNRPSSRSSRPSSRNRMVKPPATPAGLGAHTEKVPHLPLDSPAPVSPIKEGLGSVNRWSHSTASSKAPSDYGIHRRGSSKMSISGDRQSPQAVRNVVDYTRNTGNHSPQRGQTDAPMLMLPELGSTAMFAADPTSSPLDPPFTASGYIAQNQSPNKPQTDTGTARPANSVAHTNQGSISLADGEGGPESRHHSQTQKVMLSRALQKANTAVLLDNAANFEGAMEAYNDACNLLQLVMFRSNGGEEEKLKLQEIRDTYMIRITELQRLDIPLPEDDGKALPDRPLSQESYGEFDDHGIIDTQPSSLRSSLNFQDSALDDRERLASGMVPPRRQSSMKNQHPRYREPSMLQESNETTSWLDTIDESGASSPSSANSRASSVYLRRRTSRRLSSDTEAAFDAALDAAVEAAYDEGLEPVMEYQEDESDYIVANARRNIELAKQRVREAEREAEAMNRGRAMRHMQEQRMDSHPPGLDSDYLDEEAEEEERLLEEMTKGYVMDDFEFGLQSKSALPRESGSSNVSGRTWESSVTSNLSAGATLSTLAEDDDDQKKVPNTLPYAPPTSVLPAVPASSDFPGLPPQRVSITRPPMPTNEPPAIPGVRARRLSGHNRDLKINIGSRARTDSTESAMDSFATPLTSRAPPPLPKDDPSDLSRSSTPAFRSNTRNPSIGSFVENASAAANLSRVLSREEEEPELPPVPSSTAPRPMAKIPSAPDSLDRPGSSTKAFRSRNVSVSTPDTAPDSPTTPFSGSFPNLDSQRSALSNSIPIPPTPTGISFTQNGLPTGGLNLFDCDVHSPTTLGCPNSQMPNGPVPLEPCPESYLLRPFWLMRSLYQTIAHPQGGYLSAKLFIPRDVWRVKNVKLKAVEDKVSNCDLLTAALLKLAQVDTYDADAVLEEMQALENVLDQVQNVLTKKLGHEVGVQAAMPLLKQGVAPEESAHVENLPSKTSSTGNKSSSLRSWKRLRSKTSGVGGASAPIASVRESNKDNLTLNSLPMSATPSTHPKRNVTQLELGGPNANYMGALARLFDAVQVLDQIAQQVEDPGLKHSSPTHVGLELSTRHAAEFFGFYVCRFALTDVGMMLDKFIKRGSEWVLI
ncbi:uncharacterized protein PFLUO_LOCUS9171 [Penicillium psychrofluorescens]|uniref:uncharacterized protein n=1 Tax=Penicillium psychrofluorescens TaxID=3158075 RepID=UPI003CCDEEC5